jgi:hypothetical protein
LTVRNYPVKKPPAKRDPRTLRFEDFHKADRAITAPTSKYWGNGIPWGMLGNDQYGDCAEAAGMHGAQLWRDRAGFSKAALVPTAAQTLAAYSAITGFNPNNPNSDNGTVLTDALNYWRKTGFDGVQIDAYASVTPKNTLDAKGAVADFGGLYIGVELPLTAQDQFPGTWSVVPGAGSAARSWGGHCIYVTGYDAHGLYAVTWGAIQAMTWDWFETYCDEAYACLSKSWLEKCGKSPSGMAWGQLDAALANL